MSDWRDLVGILGPDLIRLVASTIQEHAAARAQRPVAELTPDDLRAAAADLVAWSVPVDAILDRASGGAWKVPQPPAGATVTSVGYTDADGRQVAHGWLAGEVTVTTESAHYQPAPGWYRPSGLPLGGGEDYTSPRTAEDDGA